MRRSAHHLITLLFLALSAMNTWAQLSEDMVKAGLIFNIIKFTEWPAARLAPQEALNICMLGQREMTLSALEPLNGKLVQGHSLLVRAATLKDGLRACHVVVIGASERASLAEALRVAHSAGALTVSDMSNFIDAGGAVGFANENDHVRFDVNLDGTNRADVHLSIQVLRLARTVKKSS